MASLSVLHLPSTCARFLLGMGGVGVEGFVAMGLRVIVLGGEGALLMPA
jgi:hypothetical protein